MSTRIALKQLTELQSNLKLKQQTIEQIRSKFQDTARAGANKPSQYATDEEYTSLFKLGPVVEELADAIKSLEVEIEHIHKYIDGALGRNSETTEIPSGGLTVEDPTTGENVDVITTDQGTGDVTVTADQLNLGDGVTIETGDDGSIGFNFNF